MGQLELKGIFSGERNERVCGNIRNEKDWLKKRREEGGGERGRIGVK